LDIGKSATETRSKILHHALNPVREIITDAVVAQACARAGYVGRECLWSPLLTLVACVWQEMNDASARRVEDWIATLQGAADPACRDGKDFCNARDRLLPQIFRDVMQHAGQVATRQAGQRYKSLPLWIVDGTTQRTPNTKENEAEFGRSKNKIRSSRSPILRLLILVCAGTGAVLAVATGGYRTS